MGPDNQNNFPNSNPLGDNMPAMGVGPTPESQPTPSSNQPLMGVPQPMPEPGQPVMGVPQPMPDVQQQPVAPQPMQAEPVQPESTLPQPELMRSESESLQPMMPQQPNMPTDGPAFTDKSSVFKSKKNLIIIGAVAGVVVIALIIAVIVIMNSGKKSSQPMNPVYNEEVTEPDENGDINGDDEEENTELSADAKRKNDYDAVVVAVNSFKASNNGEVSKLVQVKDPASLNPAKWINATGEDPSGNSYEISAYSFGKWQSEGDLAPAISKTTNGSQVFIVVGATCSSVDANGNFQPAKSDDINTFAVYGYLENGVFCKDSVGSNSNNSNAVTDGDFDF